MLVKKDVLINEVLKPSETQEEMVSSFADRAEAVRNGNVNPRFDNMLKITNDGRKLALDQRLMNEMLPDEPESKVNRCVDNAFKVWEESASDKGTQLIFCDLSTPKADGTFNVYDDVREKLVAKGVPREEVAFIHEYNTETKKADLFAKVRAGQVRILMGSTPKLGAGTNIQDRLMEISGKVYSERKEAGAAIIEACKALKAAGTEGRIGSYGAFELHSRFDNFDKVFRLSIKGAWNYSMEVGKDPQGNILRVTNALAGIERTLPQVERRLETLEQQLAQAKEEAKRPFAQESELAEKSARLAELNSLLNMDEKGSEDALGVDEDAAETEVADRLRQPVNYAGRVAERTADNVRKPSVLAQLHAKQAERNAEPQKSQKRKSHNMEL